MAFYSGSKTNQNLVFGDKGEIGNSSFAYSEAATIASTETIEQTSTANLSDNYIGGISTGSNIYAVGFYAYNNYTGVVYLYNLVDTSISPITVQASDAAQNDNFGYSVAVGSGRIVVGAYGDNSNQGAAYIFDLDGNQLAKITASDGASGDRFGQSVAIGNSRIVVGAAYDDSSSGSAYIFDLDGTQLAKITNGSNQRFGTHLAIGCGRIIIRGSVYTGITKVYDLDGNFLFSPSELTSDSGTISVGSGIIAGTVANTETVYVYDLDGKLLQTLTSSNTTDPQTLFGGGLAICSNKIIISSPNDDNNARLHIFNVNGNLEESITTTNFNGELISAKNGKLVCKKSTFASGGTPGVVIYNLKNETYDDYVEKIADNRIGQYTRLTG